VLLVRVSKLRDYLKRGRGIGSETQFYMKGTILQVDGGSQVENVFGAKKDFGGPFQSNLRLGPYKVSEGRGK